MSEAYTILSALDTILQADTDLSAVKSFTIFDDEIDLVTEKRKFPFINLNSEVRKTGKAGNQDTNSFERRTYSITISFAVREKSKSKAMTEIWDLLEAIEDSYKADRTIGGTVMKTTTASEIAVDAMKYPELNFWVGRGVMIFDVSKDEYIGI